MKLTKVSLKNYRGYKEFTTVDIGALTALIGKNDVGKSSILEALDIFFGNTKLVLSDRNISCEEEPTIIGCSFSDFPLEIVIDEMAATTLQDEFLLNEDGELEIWKEYSSACKETVYIRAHHPANEGFFDLHQKKITELRALVKNAGVALDTVSLSVNSSMRKALWNSLGDAISLEIKTIRADAVELKNIYQKLEQYLPKYVLFKSDRPSTDEDAEAQSPMQLATSAALEEQSEQLKILAEAVRQKVEAVAMNTIEKLREFDSDLASRLKPEFKKPPAWEKAFSFSLTGDNDVPINKRGSGVRRLILFSFFRATAEQSNADGRNIIYAIEEPETSQHPNFQKTIVHTLMEMLNNQNCQVLLTTHVPGLAGLLPIESLRYIVNEDGNPEIINGNDEGILKRIADTLGVYPDLVSPLAPMRSIKLIVGMEGPTDIDFLLNISRIVNVASPDIMNLAMSQSVICIPLGGGTLQHWVNHNYLQKLSIPEYHIYDRDERGSHQRDCDIVNARGDGSSARMTTKREIENYIHPDAIKKVMNINVEINDTTDVPKAVSAEMQRQGIPGYKESKVKNKLNNCVIQEMTVEQLKERDPNDEVINWLREIKSRINV